MYFQFDVKIQYKSRKKVIECGVHGPAMYASPSAP
jgi:hypothetical protein